MKKLSLVLVSCLLITASCSGSDYDNVETQSTALTTSTPTIPDGKVLTPGGAILDRACVVEVPSGSKIDAAGNVLLANAIVGHYEPCKATTLSDSALGRSALEPPTISHAWLDDTWANATTISGLTYYNYLNAQWNVPQPPTTNGALLYFFPSFSNLSTAEIVQPVLQWGNNGSFGGNYWTIASWYCRGLSCAHSAPATVHSGNHLYGSMNIASPSYVIDISYQVGNVVYADSGFESPPTIGPFNTVQGGALEAYNVTSCTQFPSDNTLDFSPIIVYQAGPHYYNYNLVNPVWSGQVDVDSNPNPSCDFTGTGWENLDNTSTAYISY